MTWLVELKRVKKQKAEGSDLHLPAAGLNSLRVSNLDALNFYGAVLERGEEAGIQCRS